MANSIQYGFYFDAAKCNGCKACHIICKDRYDAPKGVIPRRVYEYCGGGFTKHDDGTITSNAFGYYMSVSCNHCDSPACQAVCPVGAYSKDAETGLVQHDPEVCIGCKMCVGANGCPYDAPQFDETKGVMTKCDGCIDKVKEGEKPRCVAGCTQRALDFGPITELRAKYGADANVAPLPSATITGPNLVIGTSPVTRPSGSSDGMVVNLNEI